MSNLLDLGGRVACVSGASSGLGWHFAKTLATAGATVLIGARRMDRLRILAEEIATGGGRAVAVELDVRNGESVEAAMSVAVAAAGVPDILVNNSGVATQASAVTMSEEEWDVVLETNLRGTWLLSRAFARYAIAAQRPGTIINIASILGLRVVADCASYNASKAGIVHLTRSMALELAVHQIRVNALCPGFIETDLNREFLSSPVGRQRTAAIPQQRIGQMSDLDGPLLLLASPASAFMTGSTITVDGGHTLAGL